MRFLLLLVLFVGCDKPASGMRQVSKMTVLGLPSDGGVVMYTVVHDDCEWIVSKIGNTQGGISIQHKPNCYLCKERNK